MQDKYIELRINRDFGDIISTYFDFFKQNIKKFTNVFLSYNGIFLIGMLITSYLLVSGFMGLIAHEQSSGYGIASEAMDEKYMILIFSGLGLFFVLLLLLLSLNFSLASGYMILYEEKTGENFDKKEVWNIVKNKLGHVILFILALIPIFIALIIISIVFVIIPIVGALANYVVQYFVNSWLGVSFFLMFKEDKSVGASLSEGWHLVTKNFWKSVGVNFILGLLLGILILLTMFIPGVIVGLYSFHVVENDVDFINSIVATVIYTLSTCAFMVIIAYGQCLSQFVNGILYYSLHESIYNTYTRSKIEQIGEHNE